MGRLKKSVKIARECRNLQTAVLIYTVSTGNMNFPMTLRLPHMRIAEWDEVKVLPQVEGLSLVASLSSDLCMSYDTMLLFENGNCLVRALHCMLNADKAIYYPSTMTRRKLFC